MSLPLDSNESQIIPITKIKIEPDESEMTFNEEPPVCNAPKNDSGIIENIVRNVTVSKNQPCINLTAAQAGGSKPSILTVPSSDPKLSLLPSNIPPGRYMILPGSSSAIKTSHFSLPNVASSSTVTKERQPTPVPELGGKILKKTGFSRDLRFPRRRSYSVDDKLRMIAEVESGKRKTDVAKDYGVPPSTLTCILLQRNKIKLVSSALKRKRIRGNEILTSKALRKEARLKMHRIHIKNEKINLADSQPLAIRNRKLLTSHLMQNKLQNERRYSCKRTSTSENNYREFSSASISNEVSGQYKFSESNYGQNLLQELYQNREKADVKITAGGKTLKAHKLILRTASSYFEEVLSTSSAGESVVVFNDISHDSIKTVIEYMYIGKIVVSHTNMKEIVDVAKLLGVKSLLDTIRAKTPNALRNPKADVPFCDRNTASSPHSHGTPLSSFHKNTARSRTSNSAKRKHSSPDSSRSNSPRPQPLNGSKRRLSSPDSSISSSPRTPISNRTKRSELSPGLNRSSTISNGRKEKRSSPHFRVSRSSSPATNDNRRQAVEDSYDTDTSCYASGSEDNRDVLRSLKTPEENGTSPLQNRTKLPSFESDTEDEELFPKLPMYKKSKVTES